MAKGKRMLKKQTDKSETIKPEVIEAAIEDEAAILAEATTLEVQKEVEDNTDVETKVSDSVVIEEAEKEVAPKKTTTVRKTTASKKAVEKAVAKNTSSKFDVFIQYGGQEIEQQDIVTKVKNIWVKDLGNKIKDIESLSIYVKPEENAAYYVINGEVSGSIELYC